MRRLLRAVPPVAVLTALAGLVVAGSAGAATATAVLLGRSNTSAGTTRLVTTGSGTALDLRVGRAGVPPLTVNSAAVVPHLNASYVGGLSPDQLQRPLVAGCPVGSGLRAIAREGTVTCGPAYVRALQVETTAAGTQGNVADIDDPALNGHPDAVLLMTPMAGPSGGDAHPTSLWWDSAHEEWAVVNVDQAPVPVGSQFAVVVLSG